MRLNAASFFLANFEDTVTYFGKDMFRKNLSVVVCSVNFEQPTESP